MIDEKKLIEELNNINCRSNEESQLIDKVMDIIETQPNISEWIPVEERMPEENETILFSTIGETVQQGFYERVNRKKPFINKRNKIEFQKDNDKGYWHRDRFRDFIDGDLVLAWQSLPEPYRKQVEE